MYLRETFIHTISHCMIVDNVFIIIQSKLETKTQITSIPDNCYIHHLQKLY